MMDFVDRCLGKLPDNLTEEQKKDIEKYYKYWHKQIGKVYHAVGVGNKLEPRADLGIIDDPCAKP